MNEDLRIIKKYYGEKMMHLCREFFPTLLEKKGYLSKLFLDNFAPSKLLYDDIVKIDDGEKFKNFIYYIANLDDDNVFRTNKTPQELLKEVGYELYECKTEKDIQKFKKYYAKVEELCTFRSHRLTSCFVFFAVKKNVEKIKRNNFPNPEREDEYGTSVISIQFSRGQTNILSIKNRYNHTVDNPDATFSNNLENIIPGLTDSFEREYNLNICQNDYSSFDLPNYVKANDGRYYKYNYEINNIYYCPNNIIIDNFEVKQLPKEKYIILDYFILDLVNKKIIYDYREEDSFVYGIVNIQKINIINNKGDNTKTIEIEIPKKEKIIITIDKTNQIIEYKNNNIISLGNNFLYNNKKLKKIEMNKVEEIGEKFLYRNACLGKLSFPKLQSIGDKFMYCNTSLFDMNLPKVKQIKNDFLVNGVALRDISLPEVNKIGNNFMFNNRLLNKIELPKIIEIGHSFFYSNVGLREINFPNLINVGSSFLKNNRIIEKVSLPSLCKLGKEFMLNNISLVKLNLPNVEYIPYGFLNNNKILKVFTAQKLRLIDNYFLINNEYLQVLNLPQLEQIGSYFLYNNNLNLLKLYLPRLNEKDKKELLPFFSFVNEEKELYEKPIRKTEYIGNYLKNQIKIIRKQIAIKQNLDYSYYSKVKTKN